MSELSSNEEKVNAPDAKKDTGLNALRGKTISLISKIFGCVFIVVMYIVAFLIKKDIPSIEECFSILLAAIGITNILTLPIDLSMIIKNVRGKE